MTDKNISDGGMDEGFKISEKDIINTKHYGLYLQVNGYRELKKLESNWDYEVTIEVDGFKKHLTFKDFEVFIGVKYDR